MAARVGRRDTSSSFWGYGTDYNESGWVLTDDNLISGDSTLSSDSWSQVDSQYSGGNTVQYHGNSDSHYSLSNDYPSGSDTSGDASATLTIPGGTSHSTIDTFTHQHTDETVTLSMNDLNGVLAYQGFGAKSDTMVASSSLSTSYTAATTAGGNHTTSETHSWNSTGDQFTDTLSYDGLGHSVSVHSYSDWTSVDSEYSFHRDGGRPSPAVPRARPISGPNPTAAARTRSASVQAPEWSAPGAACGATATARATLIM